MGRSRHGCCCPSQRAAWVATCRSAAAAGLDVCSEASGNPGESEQQCTPSQGQEIHIVLSTLPTVIHPEDFVHPGSMFLDHVKSYSRTISVMRRMTTAITSSMLALCSAACKALRFASTAHPRGLRALTPTSAQPDEGRLRDGR